MNEHDDQINEQVEFDYGEPDTVEASDTPEPSHTIDDLINDVWTDEEVLTEFYRFLGRVRIATEFLQDEDGLITHQVIILRSGDKGFASEPFELDWPMVPATLEEADAEDVAVN